MKVDRFNEVVEGFLTREAALLNTKRADYAGGNEDCLINFKGVAEIMGVSPEFYCSTLLMKHVHSILTAIKRGDVHPRDWAWVNNGGEGLKQHISDARNFFILLSALIQEKIDDG